MVKLTKIYTRTGDTGGTSLGDGSRVRKDNARIEALGDVDEANAFLGLAASACTGPECPIRIILLTIQQDLFDVGADLCVPTPKDEQRGARLRIAAEQTARLENLIDEHNATLSPLTSFVLPGGAEIASRLHVARAVVRRAERRVAALVDAAPDATGPGPLIYLNRLSDLLFVLARSANTNADGDILWNPGDNRSDDQKDLS